MIAHWGVPCSLSWLVGGPRTPFQDCFRVGDDPGGARQPGEACGGTRGSVSLTRRVALKG
jgi:hypothetical protein